MKINFIFAPPKKTSKFGYLSEGMSPGLGLLYLATYTQKKHPEVKVLLIDGLIEGYDKTLEKVKQDNPDIVCISYLTVCSLSAYDLINDIKNGNPDIILIAGGPHATALPKEAFEKSKVDIVVMGEGEETLEEIVSVLKQGKKDFENISGIVYRRGEEIIFNNLRPYIKDINVLPFPDRSLIKHYKYFGWYLKKRTPEAGILMSRGCPFHCTFCSNVVWRLQHPKLRFRSPTNIADEIEMLTKEYGIKEIFDHSDEFNNNIENAKNICNEIINRKLDITWKCQARVNPISEDLVALMAESGCWYVNLGIESGNKRAIAGIRKNIDLDKVEYTCALFKKYKIKVHGLFILYNIWEENGQLQFETSNDVKKTLRYANRLLGKGLLDYVTWSVSIPYPGSDLYDVSLKYDLIKEDFKGKWDSWLRDTLYVLKLPGIEERAQIRMKTFGAILKGISIVKSGNYTYDDVKLLAKRGFQILLTQFK